MIIVLAQATCQACLPRDLSVPAFALQEGAQSRPHFVRQAPFPKMEHSVHGPHSTNRSFLRLSQPRDKSYQDMRAVCGRHPNCTSSRSCLHIGQLGPCGLGWILHWILLAIRKPSTNPCRQRMPPESVLGVSFLHWREHKLGLMLRQILVSHNQSRRNGKAHH